MIKSSSLSRNTANESCLPITVCGMGSTNIPTEYLLDLDAHDSFDDRDDQGQPREKATEGESYDGLYAYGIGDTTVYTEHDLDKWIIVDPVFPDTQCLDLDSMLIDLWCQGNRGGLFENSVGISYILDGENKKGLWFDVPDTDNEKLYHAVTFWYKVDEGECTTTIRMHDRLSDNLSEDYLGVLDNYIYGIHKDMAPFILYAIEQMETNPRSGALNDLELGDNFYCD